MDMGIRGWMIVIGVLLVLAVLIDGYRRMRNDRQGNIRVSLKMGGGFDKTVVEDLYSNELPNGGARVIPRDSQDLTPQAAQNDALRTQQDKNERKEPSFGDEQLLQRAESEPAISAENKPVTEPVRADKRQAVDQPPAEEEKSAGMAKTAIAEEFIIMNVHARNGAGFSGEDLLQILLACDLRFGKKNIFHRYEQANGQGAVQFSVANLVEPGVFDLDDIKNFSTPGVSFFLALPGPKEPEVAFNCMVETAKVLAKNLQGDLKDESHSVMTGQTLEHFRQRVKEFERKSLAHA